MTHELVEYEKQEIAPSNAIAQAAMTRQIEEVRGAIIMARQFPRDENQAFTRILKACKRRRLAEQSMYHYTRGGSPVTGPSIRLAEVIAQSWGNIDFGVTELESRDGESTMMAYAWDLETNTRQTKIFQVKHIRYTRKGTKNLEDPRDVYEMCANLGARRLRACLLGVIPGDIVDAAVAECEKTLKTGSKEPLSDRVRKMVAAFEEIGVTQEMIEKRIGHNVDATIEIELVSLGKIFNSLKDNMGQVEQFFERPKTSKLADAMAEEAK